MKLCVGSIVRCIKNCAYGKIGDTKKIDARNEALYGILVESGDFELVSNGDSYANKAFKEAFAVGVDKMDENFKNALLKGC
jgi:hypothetical protein